MLSFSNPKTSPVNSSKRTQFKLNGVFYKNILIFISPISKFILGKLLNVTQSSHPFVAGNVMVCKISLSPDSNIFCNSIFPPFA